jgi:hypothetical protein
MGAFVLPKGKQRKRRKRKKRMRHLILRFAKGLGASGKTKLDVQLKQIRIWLGPLLC